MTRSLPRDGLDGPQSRLPVFVERQTYRRRRLRDAARALPALGLLLWMVPLLWPLSQEPVPASRGLIYLFAVWAALVVMAGLLVQALNRGDRQAMQDAPAAPEDAP